MSFSSQIKEKLCKSEYGCMNCLQQKTKTLQRE